MESVKQELPFLKSLMKGLSVLFGENCEIVLHDHKDQPYEHTIIAIENGHVTGRKIGDCGTNLGLEVLRGSGEGHDRYNYSTRTKEGRILRSSSVYIHDSKGRVVGSVCVNFDISELIVAENTLNSFSQNPLRSDSTADEGVTEFFVQNVNELVDTLIQDSQRMIGKPVSSMTKDDKLKALQYLDERGAFLIKKSGEKVSKYFDISKYTMYNYLESLRTQDKAE